ncbi:tRNA dihydrouridine(20/20a) synthase DusA [Halorhodospira abdelmalekii]|uniref:tRNA dihydrouridine(20/20a) synthase DusA n=1 Tax=Halorhodospira abdelmalekii TaxID=421629 RepID=UPI0019061370|nr:tRNA dihydrouridine(20/20a) synthase DusA [Halorhodospira abdelmalekii]MBK1735415.1 tRNA dihydrouridine(20/20a) synthase DusA [Halorhodospira abdelmalekii]
MKDKPLKTIHGLLSVAPMMEWTTSSARYFLRLLAPRVRLYTEMVPAVALWHGRAERFLPFDPAEHPLALQLGGHDPQHLRYGAELAAEWGYDEVNLNVGCPSERVQSGRFGACLMREPELVRECVAAMTEAGLPITVKCRIGVDHDDSEAQLLHFIERVADGGCDCFIVHARKAWLQGLSPKENREIPPLHYERVWRVKECFPELEVVLNGGVADEQTLIEQLARVDGVMVGRAAFADPYALACWESRLFGGTVPSRRAAVEAYLPFVESQLQAGVPMTHLVKVLMGLYSGRPGGKRWRRALTLGSQRPGAGPEAIAAALDEVEDALPHYGDRTQWGQI